MDNIKNKKGLSITLVFKGQSLNYGEGIGNISELKKLTRGDGSVYTYASRQALRYDIVRLGNKLFNWNLQVVNKEKGTIQFDDKLTIQDSQEMDLFGYMKTAKNDGSNIRSAAVRLSNAISLEDYKSDMDFLNNKGLAISREQVLSKVWDENYFGSDRVVDDTLRRLRKKMPEINIRTIYGFGYRLD